MPRLVLVHGGMVCDFTLPQVLPLRSSVKLQSQQMNTHRGILAAFRCWQRSSGEGFCAAPLLERCLPPRAAAEGNSFLSRDAWRAFPWLRLRAGVSLRHGHCTHGGAGAEVALPWRVSPPCVGSARQLPPLTSRPVQQLPECESKSSGSLYNLY